MATEVNIPEDESATKTGLGERFSMTENKSSGESSISDKLPTEYICKSEHCQGDKIENQASIEISEDERQHHKGVLSMDVEREGDKANDIKIEEPDHPTEKDGAEISRLACIKEPITDEHASSEVMVDSIEKEMRTSQTTEHSRSKGVEDADLECNEQATSISETSLGQINAASLPNLDLTTKSQVEKDVRVAESCTTDEDTDTTIHAEDAFKEISLDGVQNKKADMPPLQESEWKDPELIGSSNKLENENNRENDDSTVKVTPSTYVHSVEESTLEAALKNGDKDNDKLENPSSHIVTNGASTQVAIEVGETLQEASSTICRDKNQDMYEDSKLNPEKHDEEKRESEQKNEQEEELGEQVIVIPEKNEIAASRENAEKKVEENIHLVENFEEKEKKDEPTSTPESKEASLSTEERLPLVESITEIRSEERILPQQIEIDLNSNDSLVKETGQPDSGETGEVSKTEAEEKHQEPSHFYAESNKQDEHHIEMQSIENSVIKHVDSEATATTETITELTKDTEELEKVPVSYSEEKTDIKGDEKIIPEDPKETEEANNKQLHKTAKESVAEDEDPSTLPTMASAGDETIDENYQEESLKDSESTLIEKDECHGPENGAEENKKDVEAFDLPKTAGGQDINKQQIIEGSVKETMNKFQDNEKEIQNLRDDPGREIKGERYVPDLPPELIQQNTRPEERYPTTAQLDSNPNECPRPESKNSVESSSSDKSPPTEKICKSEHFQADEIENQTLTKKSEDERQHKKCEQNKDVQTGGDKANAINDKIIEEPDHDLENDSARILMLASVEEPHLKAHEEDTSMDNSYLDQQLELITDQHESFKVIPENEEKETITSQTNENTRPKGEEDADLECNEQATSIFEKSCIKTEDIDTTIHVEEEFKEISLTGVQIEKAEIPLVVGGERRDPESIRTSDELQHEDNEEFKLMTGSGEDASTVIVAQSPYIHRVEESTFEPTSKSENHDNDKLENSSTNLVADGVATQIAIEAGETMQEASYTASQDKNNDICESVRQEIDVPSVDRMAKPEDLACLNRDVRGENEEDIIQSALKETNEDSKINPETYDAEKRDLRQKNEQEDKFGDQVSLIPQNTEIEASGGNAETKVEQNIRPEKNFEDKEEPTAALNIGETSISTEKSLPLVESITEINSEERILPQQIANDLNSNYPLVEETGKPDNGEVGEVSSTHAQEQHQESSQFCAEKNMQDEHHPDTQSTENLATKHMDSEATVTTEAITESTKGTEELEKVPVSYSGEKIHIIGDEKILRVEPKEMEETTDKQLHETAKDSVSEVQAPSRLPATTLIREETIEQSIEEELYKDGESTLIENESHREEIDAEVKIKAIEEFDVPKAKGRQDIYEQQIIEGSVEEKMNKFLNNEKEVEDTGREIEGKNYVPGLTSEFNQNTEGEEKYSTVAQLDSNPNECSPAEPKSSEESSSPEQSPTDEIFKSEHFQADSIENQALGKLSENESQYQKGALSKDVETGDDKVEAINDRNIEEPGHDIENVGEEIPMLASIEEPMVHDEETSINNSSFDQHLEVITDQHASFKVIPESIEKEIITSQTNENTRSKGEEDAGLECIEQAASIHETTSGKINEVSLPNLDLASKSKSVEDKRVLESLTKEEDIETTTHVEDEFEDLSLTGVQNKKAEMPSDLEGERKDHESIGSSNKSKHENNREQHASTVDVIQSPYVHSAEESTFEAASKNGDNDGDKSENPISNLVTDGATEARETLQEASYITNKDTNKDIYESVWQEIDMPPVDRMAGAEDSACLDRDLREANEGDINPETHDWEKKDSWQKNDQEYELGEQATLFPEKTETQSPRENAEKRAEENIHLVENFEEKEGKDEATSTHDRGETSISTEKSFLLADPITMIESEESIFTQKISNELNSQDLSVEDSGKLEIDETGEESQTEAQEKHQELSKFSIENNKQDEQQSETQAMVTTKTITISTKDTEELDKVPELHSGEKTDIKGDEKIISDEPKEIEEVNDKQSYETAQETGVNEDQAPSRIPATALIRDETIEQGIEEEILTEKQDPLVEDLGKLEIDETGGKSETETQEKYQELSKFCIENNKQDEQCSETQITENLVIKHMDPEALDKVPESHSEEKIDIKGDEKIISEVPKETEEATDKQVQETVKETDYGVSEDEALSRLPTRASVRDEAIEQSFQEESPKESASLMEKNENNIPESDAEKDKEAVEAFDLPKTKGVQDIYEQQILEGSIEETINKFQDNEKEISNLWEDNGREIKEQSFVHDPPTEFIQHSITDETILYKSNQNVENPEIDFRTSSKREEHSLSGEHGNLTQKEDLVEDQDECAYSMNVATDNAQSSRESSENTTCTEGEETAARLENFPQKDKLEEEPKDIDGRKENMASYQEVPVTTASSQETIENILKVCEPSETEASLSKPKEIENTVETLSSASAGTKTGKEYLDEDKSEETNIKEEVKVAQSKGQIEATYSIERKISNTSDGFSEKEDHDVLTIEENNNLVKGPSSISEVLGKDSSSNNDSETQLLRVVGENTAMEVKPVDLDHLQDSNCMGSIIAERQEEEANSVENRDMEVGEVADQGEQISHDIKNKDLITSIDHEKELTITDDQLVHSIMDSSMVPSNGEARTTEISKMTENTPAREGISYVETETPLITHAEGASVLGSSDNENEKEECSNEGIQKHKDGDQSMQPDLKTENNISESDTKDIVKEKKEQVDGLTYQNEACDLEIVEDENSTIEVTKGLLQAEELADKIEDSSAVTGVERESAELKAVGPSSQETSVNIKISEHLMEKGDFMAKDQSKETILHSSNNQTEGKGNNLQDQDSQSVQEVGRLKFEGDTEPNLKPKRDDEYLLNLSLDQDENTNAIELTQEVQQRLETAANNENIGDTEVRIISSGEEAGNEVEVSTSEFTEQIESTKLTEESKSVTLENRTEQNMDITDSSALKPTDASETCTEDSSFIPKVYEKETEVGFIKKDDPATDDPKNVPVIVEIEETGLKDAEPGHIDHDKDSDIAIENEGETAITTDKITSDSIDTVGREEENLNPKRKGIPEQLNDDHSEMDYRTEETDETTTVQHERELAISTIPMSLDYPTLLVEEKDAMGNATVHPMDERSIREEINDETAETNPAHSIANTLLQKEHEVVEPGGVSGMESVNITKECSNEESPDLENEDEGKEEKLLVEDSKCTARSTYEDRETMQGQENLDTTFEGSLTNDAMEKAVTAMETKDFGHENEPTEEFTLEKTIEAADTNMKVELASESMAKDQSDEKIYQAEETSNSEDHISESRENVPGQRSQGETLREVDMQFEVEHHTSVAQNAHEASVATCCTENVPEATDKAIGNEIILEHTPKPTGNLKEFDTLSVGYETISEAIATNSRFIEHSEKVDLEEEREPRILENLAKANDDFSSSTTIVEQILEPDNLGKKFEIFTDSKDHYETNEQLPQTVEKSNNVQDCIFQQDAQFPGIKYESEKQRNLEPQMEAEQLSIPPYAKETLVTSLITKEAHDGVDRAAGSENIDKQIINYEVNSMELQILSERDETVNQVRYHNLMSNEDLKATVDFGAEDDPMRKEASSAIEASEENMQDEGNWRPTDDRTAGPQVLEDKKEKKTEAEGDNSINMTKTTPVEVQKVESREAQLDDKPMEGSNLNKQCPETIKIGQSQPPEEIIVMEAEKNSPYLFSQLHAANENAGREIHSPENPEGFKDFKIAPPVVELKEQDIEDIHVREQTPPVGNLSSDQHEEETKESSDSGTTIYEDSQKDSSNEVHERGRVLNVVIKLDPHEKGGQGYTDSISESKQIKEATESEEAANFKRSEKAFEYVQEVHSDKVLTELEDEEKHIKTEENQSDITTATGETMDTQVLNDKIKEGQEAAQDFQQIYICERGRSSDEETERSAIEYPIRKTNKTFQTISNDNQNEVKSEAIEMGEYENIKDNLPDDTEGKNVREAVTRLTHENQGTAPKITGRRTEVMAQGDKDQEPDVDMSQKGHKGPAEASEHRREIRQLEESSLGTVDTELSIKADAKTRKTNADVERGLRNSDKGTIREVQPENAKSIDTRLEGTRVEENISSSNMLQRSTEEPLQAATHLDGATELAAKTPKEETPQVEEAKIDSEKDEGIDENQGIEPLSGASVVVETSKDKDAKVAHKKSHNILSGVGSKVKHSISKVKKAITGRSSHSKTSSPK